MYQQQGHLPLCPSLACGWGHLQYLHSLDTDAAANDGDFGGEDGPGSDVGSKLRHDALPCELGIRYPNLQAILSGKRNIQTTLVLYTNT